MTEISLLDSKFEVIGTFKTEVKLAPEEISVPAVHQVVKALLASRRQGNASNKNKAAVAGGGAKPFKQKGSGRARQGSKRSPLQVGGGSVFGPVPRSYTQKVNRRMMVKAIHSILADKFQAGRLVVLEEIASTNGKSKELFKILHEKNLKTSLIVTQTPESMALRAIKNVHRVKGLPVCGFSVYEAIKHENLIIEKAALEILLRRIDRYKRKLQ